MNKDSHPFYCHKKKCRKTAWDTPQYLSVQDWQFAKEFIEKLQVFKKPYKERDIDKFKFFLYNDYTLSKNFFYHTIGWPEGFNYCYNDCGVYVEKTAIPSFIKHTEKELLDAIKKNS